MNCRDLTRLISSLRKSLQRWAPPPKLTVSEWADRHRMLSPESSAAHGKWKTDRAPYQRGIMDAITDPSVEEITFIKSAQVGATEIINNGIGYYIHQDPSPMLMVMPTKEIAAAWSKDRLAPMLRDTPVLRGKVHTVKTRDADNTILHKRFAGGHLTIGGANSPSGLASRPIRITWFDEVDRFPISAGTEGDPISLGMKRTTTFWNRKIIMVSTPTIDGESRIQKSWEQSDQRRYWVPCPHCGEKHLLEWHNIVWEKTEEGEHLPETAAHVCPHCGTLEEDADLPKMLSRGEWIAGKPEVKGHAGFHINELYSPWVRFSETVKSFLRSKGDRELMKTWTNTALGEVFVESEEIGEAEDLMMRCENYDAEMVPWGGVVITVGVDVHDDRLECEAVAWGANYENWSLEYKIINIDPVRPECWNVLDEFLTKTYLHESGKRLRIMGTGIDTGGHRTKNVYAYCKPRWARGVYALKGEAGRGKPLASRPSKNNSGKVRLYRIGTETAKDMIQGHLNQKEPGPGYCHFPNNYGKYYFDGLLSEKKVPVFKNGQRSSTWRPIKAGIRNEPLDCRVYALAVLDVIGVDLNGTVRRFMEMVGQNPEIMVIEKQQNGGMRRRRATIRGSIRDGRNYARTG